MRRANAPRVRLRAALRTALLAALLAGAAACARFPANPPLAPGDLGAGGYRFSELALGDGNTNGTFVVVTLSGGGTRAAAFSYGALCELERWRLPGGATLLDEVDVVSSVSGGSFAAAHLGVFGKERFLRVFPEDVLLRPIERDLVLRLLAPWHWWKLASWWYGRSDLAAEYYDRHVFAGARYGDLPRTRPLVQLNATDIGLGARFSFVQDHFDRLCSDLDAVPVARGVTASSAFPVAFTPLTLENHDKAVCGYETPAWVAGALRDDLEVNPSRYDRARAWLAYEDDARDFIHLGDGGIADNIGLRGPMLGLQTPHAAVPLVREINRTLRGDPGGAERVALVVVDAKPGGAPAMDRSAHPPGVATVLQRSATTPMERYSSDTVEIARRWIDAWERQFLDAGETSPVAFYRAHVRFEADSEDRAALQAIGTRLQLPEAQVARLVRAGARILARSAALRRLASDLGATRSPAAACPLAAPEP